MATFPEIAQQLRATMRNAADRTHGWDEEYVEQKWRGGERWSRKEIFGHLVDSAANNHQRFIRAAIAGDYAGPNYQQDAWIAAGAYQDFNWDKLQSLWLTYNALIAHVLERIPTERAQASCSIGNGDPVTLQFLAEDYVAHLQRHLDQIFQR